MHHLVAYLHMFRGLGRGTQGGEGLPPSVVLQGGLCVVRYLYVLARRSKHTQCKGLDNELDRYMVHACKLFLMLLDCSRNLRHPKLKPQASTYIYIYVYVLSPHFHRDYSVQEPLKEPLASRCISCFEYGLAEPHQGPETLSPKP